MRVLIVAPHLPPAHVGGVEVYSKQLVSGLLARGLEVRAVAVERVRSAASDACEVLPEADGASDVARLDLALSRRTSFTLLTDHAPAEQWFDRQLADWAPDVVHVQSGYLLGVPALRAAARAGVPAVLSVHDYWAACPRVTLLHPDGRLCSGPDVPAKCAWCLSSDRRAYRLLDGAAGGRLTLGQHRSALWRLAFGKTTDAIERRRQAVRAAFGTIATVLAPSAFVARQVTQAGVPAAQLAVRPFGLPAAPPRRRTPVSSLHIGYIGQVAPHKGVDLAVRAVRALPGRAVRLSIHGPLTPYPGYVAHLRALAGDDPRIELAGPYPREAVYGILEGIDVLVVPSVWHEVAALAIQEAQMAGVPVVASALGGSPEFVRHDENGLLVDVSDPDGLRAAFERLLDEPDLLPRLARGTRPGPTVDDDLTALVALYHQVRRRP